MTISTLLSLLAIGANAVEPSEPDCIPFDEYVEKYGEENVIEGLEAMEAEAMGYDKAELASRRLSRTQNAEEGKSLYECLSEGEFLGFKVLGVTDVTPGDPTMMIRLDPESGALPSIPMVETENDPASVAASTAATSTIVSTDPSYKVYYSDTRPDQEALDSAYEEKSGSYFYKYSYSWTGYLAETTVTFTNKTELHCGTEATNFFVFLHARSDTATIDFGLMANPSANDRNKGLYAFRNSHNSNGSHLFYVEAVPKIKTSSYSSTTKTMKLSNATVKIRISATTNEAELYMENNGSMAYYELYDLPGLSSGSGKSLTFIQAMSLLGENADTIPTNLQSGSYAKNVKFSNTYVYEYGTNVARPLTTVGPYTYFTFICRPDYISYNYSDTANTETVSIEYK